MVVVNISLISDKPQSPATSVRYFKHHVRQPEITSMIAKLDTGRVYRRFRAIFGQQRPLLQVMRTAYCLVSSNPVDAVGATFGDEH